MILNQIVSFIGIIFNSTKASVGNLFATAEQDPEAKLQLFKCCELIDFLLVGFTTICTVVLSEDIIKLCFGNEYVLPKYIVIAIAANFYTNNIRQSIWMFRETSGLFQPLRYITVVTAILNIIILSITLGRLFGMFGIIIATVISRMAYAWWKEPMVLYRKLFNCSSKEYFITYFSRVLLTAVLIVICLKICSVINTNGIITDLVIKTFITVGISCATMFVIFRKTTEFEYIIKRFRKTL